MMDDVLKYTKDKYYELIEWLSFFVISLQLMEIFWVTQQGSETSEKINSTRVSTIKIKKLVSHYQWVLWHILFVDGNRTVSKRDFQIVRNRVLTWNCFILRLLYLYWSWIFLVFFCGDNEWSWMAYDSTWVL